MSSAQRFFARDYDALADGERFTTRARTITEADVVSFAALTGDFHPVHTDAVWAEQSPFGGRIAHGMLVLSYAVGLVPLDPERVVALRRIGDAVFKQPARFGDTIHVEGEVSKRSEVDAQVGLVECRWKVLNQDRKTVVRVTVEVLWRRGELGAGDEARSSGELGAGDGDRSSGELGEAAAAR